MTLHTLEHLRGFIIGWQREQSKNRNTLLETTVELECHYGQVSATPAFRAVALAQFRHRQHDADLATASVVPTALHREGHHCAHTGSKFHGAGTQAMAVVRPTCLER